MFSIIRLMKTEKILHNLNSSFDEASSCARKHNKMLKIILKEIKVVEKRLLKKLQKESHKKRKKKLKKKLHMIKAAYESFP
jgi:hypothetical protein